MGVAEINAGSFLWCGVGIVPCVFLFNPFAPQYQETTIKVGFGTLRRGGGGGGGVGEANISLTSTSTLLRDKSV